MAINAGDIVYYITGDDAKLKAAMASAKQGFANLGSAVQQNARAIGVAFTAVGGAITGALGLATKSAMDFQGAMAEVNTLGINDLGAMSDAVKDVAATYGQDLTNSAKAAYQAISAGASEAQAPKLLAEAAKAATAGVSDLTTAIELGTSVSNAYGKSLDDVSGVYDQAFIAVKNGVTTFEELSASVGKVTPIMAAAGVKSEEMFAAIAALTKGGIATSEAVTGLKAAMTGIIKPTKEASELADALGIDFSAAALKSRGLKGFLDELGQAIQARGPELAAHRSQLEQTIAQWDASAASNKQQAAAMKEEIEQSKYQSQVFVENAKAEIENLKNKAEWLEANGRSSGNLRAQIQQLNTEIANAKNYTSSLSAEYKGLVQSSKSTKEQLSDLKQEYKALEGVSDDQLTMMAAMFGSVEGLNAVLALTGEQAGSFAQTLTDMSKATGATQEAFNKLVESDPGFAWRQLKSEMAVLGVEIGQALMPTIRALMDDLRPLIRSVREWIKAHPELTQQIVKVTAVVGALMTALGPVLIALPGLTSAFGLVSGAAGVMSGGLGVIVAMLTGPVGIAAAIAVAIPVVYGYIDAMKEANKAQRELEEAQKQNKQSVDNQVEALKKQGVELDSAKIATMGQAETMEYLKQKVGEAEEAQQREISAINGVNEAYKDHNAQAANVFNALQQQGASIDQVTQAYNGLSAAAQEAFRAMYEAAQMGMNAGVAPEGFQAAGGVIRRAMGGMIPRFARGGRVTMVGERGPEVAAFPVGTRIMSNQELRSIVRDAAQPGGRSGMGDINITVNATGSVANDPDVLSRSIANRLGQELAFAGWA